MKPSEQGSLFHGGQNEYNKSYATIKTEVSWFILDIASQNFQGLFFWGGQNEYATIKTEQKLSILVNTEWIFTKPSEQGLFFWGSWNEYNKSYGTIKTEQKVKFLSKL